MNDMITVFNKLKKDKKMLALVICGLLVICMLFISELFSAKEEKAVSVTDTSAYSRQYIKNAEKDLEKILSKINGAGKVTALITLENCYENVYAKAYTQDNDKGENMENTSYKEEFAIVKKGSSNEECLIIKVYEPKIKGVAVVCEGGEKTAVKKAITDAVCALYDISTDKVSVSKMN